MFKNEELQKHLEESQTIRSRSAVIAEWNMNIPENIEKIGNYRYRPTQPESKFALLPNTFDMNDDGQYYTGATDSDVKIDGGLDEENENIPTTILTKKEKFNTIYSLEDCFKQFRPRSGINKARFIGKSYIHHSNVSMANRPRYYMADRQDPFKYWTSYRKEDSIEYGVANKLVNSQNSIEDTVPFVVYKKDIPTNRIVVKMQTHTGDVNLGSFTWDGKTFLDPFYGDSNKATPKKWKIQTLKNNNWVDTISFNANSTRPDGTPIIGSDGYVELMYGLKVPDKYKKIFSFAETISSTVVLPDKNIDGYAYLLIENENEIGRFYIWNDGIYETFVPTYGWQLAEEETSRLTNFVTDFTNPSFYNSASEGLKKYREFENVRGIRIVVDTMTKVDTTFDLIEISPRLASNITDRVTDFSVTKSASDLGISGLPVGQLLASTGKIKIFDYDDSFSEINPNSIIKDYLSRNIQFKFYDIVVDLGGYDYYIPIKTMYSDSFPEVSNSDKTADITLRDMFFNLESSIAPQMLLTNVSTSSAISLLLDSTGFSNYTFRRVAGEKEMIIPYFFIPPDTSVAQVLQDIAISTQTAMFFDEYNNFITMSKNYIMPSLTERETDITLYGTRDQSKSGIVNNAHTNNKLANIIDFTTQDTKPYNDGSITYTSRSIQRSIPSVKQAMLIDNDRTYIYKPVLLWEVTGEENLKSSNGQVGNQSNYLLSAIPLNSNLSASVPTVVNNTLQNNTMNFGEAVYWLSRYNGYFYAGGEIIKYDAIEYNVAGVGNVWITDVQEYSSYLSKVPFNGKMYPTGSIRIYAEPNYEEVSGVLRLKNGAVAKHGRGQFGTPVVAHSAGLDPYWSDNANLRGVTMKSDVLFNSSASELPTSAEGLTQGAAGLTAFVDIGTPPVATPSTSNDLAKKTTRNGIIRNFLASTYLDQSTTNTLQSTQAGAVQSSALVISGPVLTTYPTANQFVSYVYKKLSNKFTHFGTRVRIVGKIENNIDSSQSAVGNSTYYVIPGDDPSKNISISGGGGGMAVLINPETNNGYYFEIAALGSSGLTNKENSNVNNVFFYKILKDNKNNAVPVKLWEGLTSITVDDGNFVGQYRVAAEENPTVYDLSVEYQDIGSIRRFFLYINNTLIKTVDDISPLPIYNNMALFVRGGSRLMFENVFAISNNYSKNTAYALSTPVNSIFDDGQVTVSESFRKYSMSGIIQSTYLSGIESSDSPSHNIYFEEFGTIMREASLFNVRYDKAWPALYAKMSPTFNSLKGYTVSGFRAGSYGAEFMIFNSTDTALSLSSDSGNYLRIQGVTFTQQSQNSLKVDEYFSKLSNLADPDISNGVVIGSPLKAKKDYEDIKVSRLTYGKKDFNLNVPYVQTQDDANDLMKWTISKIMKPRRSIGVKVFALPTVQLGDIVNVDYFENGINKGGDNRFIVYSIQYSKSDKGPDMTLYLSEVV